MYQSLKSRRISILSPNSGIKNILDFFILIILKANMLH